jgi:cell division protein FtsQ
MSEVALKANPQANEIPASERSKPPLLWNRVALNALFWTGICLDIFMALVLTYLVVVRSSYFNLSKVDVYGNHRLSTEEVIETTKVEKGVNLLDIDLESITQRLRHHPWIREGAVSRRFPGQLVVEIEERIPRGIVASEKLYYIDENAKIFTRILPGDLVGLPLFTGIRPDELRSAPKEVQESLLSGLKLTELLDRSGSEISIKDIREINISHDDGLTLKMNSGQVIIFGNSGFETKIARYERLKRFLKNRGQWRNARIINLDFEDRAIVRSSEDPLLQG